MARKEATMAKKPKLDFEKLIEKGENPKGFTSQTVNGTAHWSGTGWNGSYWNEMSMPELPPGPTRPSGRSNRTGE